MNNEELTIEQAMNIITQVSGTYKGTKSDHVQIERALLLIESELKKTVATVAKEADTDILEFEEIKTDR